MATTLEDQHTQAGIEQMRADVAYMREQADHMRAEQDKWREEVTKWHAGQRREGIRLFLYGLLALAAAIGAGAAGMRAWIELSGGM